MLPVESDGIRAAFEAAAGELGLTTMALPSGAGHDAQPLAAITPSGMIFVPSRGGVSHDPAELTSWDDCVNGANVLLNAAVRFAEAGLAELAYAPIGLGLDSPL